MTNAMRTYAMMTVLAAMLLTATGSHAQQNAPLSYPVRPIRLLTPFPPGGLADVVARLLAQKLGESFKQTLVVDNRSGGGGSIAVETAVRANPDGYTMILVTASYTSNAAIYKLPFDPITDITPVILVGVGGNVATVHPAGPVASIKEVIAYDKANPGKLNYGSSGTGSSPHLATELLNQMAGIRLTHVPYKGTPVALNDLLGGQIQFLIGSLPALIPQIKSNRLRGVGVTMAKRSSAIPEVPTVAETLPGYEVVNWGAVWGPKGLPADIVARWNREINRLLLLPDVKDRLAASGLEPAGGTPQQLLDVIQRDIAKWRGVVKAANIKPET
jgi:tripartite-type tricarboxylate transporter receptor subunit TctC